MNKINKNFLNSKLSLEFKNLGFDESCLGYYNSNNKFKLTEYPVDNKSLDASNYYDSEMPLYHYTAPLYQQAVDFLLEKYQIDVDICLFIRKGNLNFYCICLCEVDKMTQIVNEKGEVKMFKNKYEAYDEAFIKAFKIISASKN